MACLLIIKNIISSWHDCSELIQLKHMFLPCRGFLHSGLTLAKACGNVVISRCALCLFVIAWVSSCVCFVLFVTIVYQDIRNIKTCFASKQHQRTLQDLACRRSATWRRHLQVLQHLDHDRVLNMGCDGSVMSLCLCTCCDVIWCCLVCLVVPLVFVWRVDFTYWT